MKNDIQKELYYREKMIRDINIHMNLTTCKSIAECYIIKDTRQIYLCQCHSDNISNEVFPVKLDSFQGCQALIEK